MHAKVADNFAVRERHQRLLDEKAAVLDGLTVCHLALARYGRDPTSMSESMVQAFRDEEEQKQKRRAELDGELQTCTPDGPGLDDGPYTNGAVTAEEKPTIQVNNRALCDVSSEAQQALLAKNTPPFLFVRGGQLARIITDERGRPLIDMVGEAALRGDLSRVAHFVRTVYREDKKTGQTSFIDSAIFPPRDVGHDILALSVKPFPPLLGLVESPVLRPDGTIIATPGYDPATRLFYKPTVDLTLPAVAEQPTAEDAWQARTWIHEELLSDFPFAEAADLTNFFATLLTPIMRPAIRGNVPLALIDKPTPGSGASLLTDLVATIASGEHAAKLTAPEGRNAEDEWRKRITALLLDGAPIGVIDNVEEDALASASLSRLLTAGVWKDRLLGSNLTVTLPVHCTLIATGNNIGLHGDLARRCYRVRLDPQVEKPWEREEFKHPNLLGWTYTYRGELLALLLTMARAWFAAGQPTPSEKLPTLGGFEEWVRILGGILTYAGLDGFLSNQQALYDLVDDEGPQWREFLTAWHEIFGEEWITVRYLAGSVLGLPADSPLVQSLPETVGWDGDRLENSRIKLGKALKKQAFRIYGQYKLERGGAATHAKVAKWRVIEM